MWASCSCGGCPVMPLTPAYNAHLSTLLLFNNLFVVYRALQRTVLQPGRHHQEINPRLMAPQLHDLEWMSGGRGQRPHLVACVQPGTPHRSRHQKRSWQLAASHLAVTTCQSRGWKEVPYARALRDLETACQGWDSQHMLHSLRQRRSGWGRKVGDPSGLQPLWLAGDSVEGQPAG
jgi:hypothetical protein